MSSILLTEKVAKFWPGLGMVVIVSFAALFLSEHYSTPVMLLALLLGISVSFLYEETRCREGIGVAASFILRIGVALIGMRIAASDLVSLGWEVCLLLAVAVASTIAFGVLVCKISGHSRSFGVLSGGAVGICGASAALAISSVLPESKDKERYTILTVLGVTFLSTIAMIVYPIVVTVLGFSEIEASLFLGGTIHDVAQVVGAGYSLSEQTGDLSVLAKLLRVSLLIPVVIMFMLYTNSRRALPDTKRAPILPWFLVVFILLVTLNSLVTIPEVIKSGFSEVSRFALVMAIVAIGMKSNLRQLLQVGIKPILILLAETLWIAGLILGYILIF